MQDGGGFGSPTTDSQEKKVSSLCFQRNKTYINFLPYSINTLKCLVFSSWLILLSLHVGELVFYSFFPSLFFLLYCGIPLDPPRFLVDSCPFTSLYNPVLAFLYLNHQVNVSYPLYYLVLISNLALLNLFYSVLQLKLSQYFLALSNSFKVQHIIKQMIHSNLGIMN